MTITGFTFKSYDKKAGVLQFEIKNQDGSPTDLIDATVRLFMYIYQGEEKKEFPIFDNQIITESYMQGVVKYPIPDMLLSYEGKVDANVYIDFPDGSHTDNLAFTFNIEKSVIDDNAQLNGEYYFKDFQQLLDGVKQEATDAVNAALTNVDSTIEKANQQINEFVEGATQAIDQTVDEVTEQLQATQTKIDTVSQNVTSAQNNLKVVEDKMNQTNQQIGDLGKMKKMYSNSLEFGGYDYSGNPNVMTKPYIAENITGGTTGLVVTSIDDGARIEKTRVDVPGGFELPLGNLLNNTDYIISYDVLVENGYTGDLKTCNIALEGQFDGKRNYIAVFYMNSVTSTDVWQKVYVKFNSGANMEKLSGFMFRVFLSQSVQVALKIKNVKIERGSTATPYQPNLLDAPYYLSKVPLGENLIKPESQQPVTNSNYLIKTYNTKPMVKGKKYTITLEGTKPATQVFRPFFTQATGSPWGFGDLKPVEGVTDTWSATFTASTDSHPTSPQVQIYQVPNTSVGQCTIKWLKLEEGDTRTPNIEQYKYFGEGLKYSNNPNDYSWDITPEYTEKGLNDSVSLTEPETVLGLKNFEDGLQIAGKEVATVSEDTGWVNLTAINGHSWSKQGQIRRIGKLVMFRGSLKGSTLSTQDFCTIPEGFRPSNPTDNYEYQFLLPPQSSNTLDNGGMAYIRPNGVCGLPSFRGTANLFLAPIQYYID
ncbi:TPA: BppU family phage baseplate upper protein [Enterococcus faecium]|uniref:BppU family phage baseplate upper protein n=1 Tax=Enterococcus faecium TaxID=1352 RepID=UPI00298875E7|nr:BppU family phage baseplate upper protein [Enterococcus faecium]HAZ0637394.1 BppU family phage baseplate upper protein [Enterococcus faecium]HAZ1081612.1 BppU family phage baseplate upper protein [Enterococcus faecium]HCQ8784056.1 BppU family phage baseplate upper protein [Enterococcus faecium]HCZ8405175.1 BppU family phage baseplate upper protein [Enterococcus faecium]